MSSSGQKPFWIGRFGKSFELIHLEHVSTSNWPVVSQTAYVWTVGTLAVITLIVGVIRILLRLKVNGRLDLHDALFTFALCCSTGSAIIAVFCASYFYAQAEISIGSITFVNFSDIVPAVVQYLQILYTVSAIQWIAIYSVKICYLMFFNKLTSRLRGLRIWWWVVLFFTIPGLMVSGLLGLWVCHDFGPDILLRCPIPDMNNKAKVLNRITGVMDITTDFMIISIPIILITKVKIDIRRKWAIGAILSLSSAMIAIAFARLFPPTIHILPTDGPYNSFLEAVETSIANIMVSITSFKSIYGGINQSNSSPKRASAYPGSRTEPSFGSRMGRFLLRSTKSNTSTTQSSEKGFGKFSDHGSGTV